MEQEKDKSEVETPVQKLLADTKSMRAMREQLATLSAAAKINSMATQNVSEQMRAMKSDMERMQNFISELQFRVLALSELSGAPKEKVAEVTEAIKVKSYEEAAARADAAEGYTPAESVTENSVVVLTSTVDDTGSDNKGYFRARLKMVEMSDAALKEKLLGKGKNYQFDHVVQGVVHHFTLLDVKEAPAAKQGEADVGSQTKDGAV